MELSGEISQDAPKLVWTLTDIEKISKRNVTSPCICLPILMI